jgi:hypothetical protein
VGEPVTFVAGSLRLWANKNNAKTQRFENLSAIPQNDITTN